MSSKVLVTGGSGYLGTQLIAALLRGGRQVRATVRSRRWYMDQIGREVAMQTAPLKLYLTEDFHEAARAFAEKRRPGPFKGR